MEKTGQEPEISLSHFKNILEAGVKAKKALTEQERIEIQIVTPMFGGGHKSGEVDQAIPVRASAIRGHLRFWWRATRGAAYENVSALRRREVAIFGDTNNPSRVRVWIDKKKTAQPKPAMEEYLDRMNRRKKRFVRQLVTYAVFPYRDTKNSENKARTFSYLPSYDFTLCLRIEEASSSGNNESNQDDLTVDDVKKEVYAAIWAWINFGGLGSRTRRGCGSLYCAEFSPGASDMADLKQWFEKQLKKHNLMLPPRGILRGWPTLCSEFYVKSVSSDYPDRAWKGAIDTYQRFRSLSNTKSGEKKRSHWPEADSLRKMMGMAEPDHENPNTLSSGDLEYAFPRAQFGMPIIFEFKQDIHLKSRTDGKREPYKSQLVPKERERLASPLIVKALAVGNSKKITGISMFAILNQPELDEVELQIQEQGGNTDIVEKRLKRKPIEKKHIYPTLKYEKSPMKDLNGNPVQSAIDAFLDSEEVRTWLKIKTDRG
ncbi:type III-B CRISPR module RAMP protein Cmr1 [Paenibacillus sp. y28]|uniref:type III-B CRISPR module RAMP protein Cmr1 n=1 Tax=Paenibacillus sp. y28 TaxID=3129110 RepID=UPI00301943AC